MVFESSASAFGFAVARAVFSFVLGYMALGNLLDFEATAGYAGSKGVPMPRLSVAFGSTMLLAGAASILLGVFPLLGAAAIAAFLVAITPVMHDFWTIQGQEAQNEQVHFLKNVGLLSVAIIFASLASSEWPYALGIGL